MQRLPTGDAQRRKELPGLAMDAEAAAGQDGGGKRIDSSRAVVASAAPDAVAVAQYLLLLQHMAGLYMAERAEFMAGLRAARAADAGGSEAAAASAGAVGQQHQRQEPSAMQLDRPPPPAAAHVREEGDGAAGDGGPGIDYMQAGPATAVTAVSASSYCERAPVACPPGIYR